jgi:hypothetical protein
MKSWLVLILLLLIFSSAAQADMILLSASKDATIYGANVNNSNGAGPGIFAGTDGNSAKLRSLIAFDVAGNLPAGATISGAQLTLVLGQVPTGSPATSTVELHRLIANWGEGVTLKATPPNDTISGTGQGVAAGDGDATWNARFFSASAPTAWATAGGDFAATASASATIGSTIGQSFPWSSTALVTDVQGWLDNPTTNFGWELVNTNEASARTLRAFYTRDANTAAFRPQLSITYMVPEPSSLCQILVALVTLGFGLSWRQGKRFAVMSVPSIR